MPRTVRPRSARRPRRAEVPAVAFEGQVTSVGAQGDGLIPGAQGPIYVPFTVPGDRVSGTRRGERAEAVTLLAEGPARVPPPCPVFGACGGCALQHMETTALAAWKRDHVAMSLAARGFVDPPVAEIVTMPRASRRRVTLRWSRSKRETVLGFHARRSHALVPATGCLIVTEAIARAWDGLTALVGEAGAGGALHVLDSDTGLDIDLRPDDPLDAAAEQRAIAAAGALDAARLSHAGEILIQWRAPDVAMGAARVMPAPGGFLQPSREGQAALTTLVLDGLGPGDGAVADLYAGCGTFALALSATRPVHAVENDPAALQALDRAVRGLRGHKALSHARRDLDEAPLSVKELSRFDGLVLDPPRAGAAAQAALIARSPVRRIAAVSCNPATFARDARALVDGGYRLERVTPVDQFIWSPHIECVGVFSRP